MHSSFFIKTYGCQMNDYDSEKINRLLSLSGYKETTNPEESDITILNTCHIREKATEKLYSDLGRLALFKENKIKAGKEMKIVVTGCVAQAEGQEIIKRNGSVDYVLGPQNYHVLPNILSKRGEKKIFTDFLCEEKFASLPVSSNGEVSKLVTIQEGCDKFCSFCVVPYTRGAEFSRKVEDIFAEVQNLVSSGVKEITLLGQNVSAYKSSELGNKEINLSDLCKVLSKIKKLKRIRYLTSHPIDIDEKLIEEHSSNEKLMPFLHLPIQSGSDKILKKMNRKHSKEYYLNLIKKIKKHVPNMAFSSDFIVGYPGELEKDFEDTLDLISQVKFASSYSFKYSSRPGTPSSLKETNISEVVLNERLKRIQSLLLKQQDDFNKSFLNKTVPVLVSHEGKKPNQFVGRTEYLQPVHFFSETDLTGKMLNIKLDGLTSFSFHGTISS